MFDPSANDSASHNLSKLGAAASTENATPYGLPIESVSNLTVAGQDLVTVAFDAAADHLLKGKTRVSFAIKNQGSVAAGPFKANVVYSKDATIGNGDDIVIKSLSVGRLNAGGKLSRSLNVALPLDELNGSAIKEDRPNRGGNYVSRNRDYLGVVIDANNQVSESNERNNVSQKEGVGKDGITYFPWDINGDGRVTGNDVNFVKSRLGRTGSGADPRADFDGDRKITDIDLAAISDRVGYRINPKVISPSIIALQPKQNGQREPVIEGVITDFNNVKTVRAKFTNAPKKNFVNITRDIGKAGDFSLNANRIKAIYGAALPGGKNQQLQIEILDKKGKNIGKKRVTFGAASTGPDKPRNDPGESTQRALRIGQLKS
ncbi:MAG: CARDB domain-containing protein, partial [Cyanobacteria bacterium J06560_2]